MIALRSLCALVALLLLVPAAPAQDKKDPPKPDTKVEPTKRGQLPTYWRQLGLTDEQKEKVYRIQAEFQVKLDELAKKTKDLKEGEKKDLEKLLTDAQKARLKEILTSKVPGGGSSDANKPEKPEKSDKPEKPVKP